MNMVGIDLFAGSGGMSLGAKMAGINVRIVVEQDKNALATYKHNFHDKTTHFFGDDIRKFKKIKIQTKRLPLIIFGGPPCQGFSTSNQRTRSLENPNNWLFEEFIRVVNLYEPDWVVLENVQGIKETKEGIFLNYILESLERYRYTTSVNTLDSSRYGVPQKRNRLFIVASRDNKKFIFPEQSTRRVTVKNALGDLPMLSNGANICVLEYARKATNKYATEMRGDLSECSNNLVTNNAHYVLERYKHIPQGGNWETIPKKLMKNYKDRSRCHTGIYRRLEENKPSSVIGNFRKNMLIHPTYNRGLSVREAARLQSFPDWFHFEGSIGFQQQQVGNAVPPLLAKAVFEQIVRS